MCVSTADSMDSSSKQFVSVDEVAVVNGDSSAGTVHQFCCVWLQFYLSTILDDADDVFHYK